MAEIDTSAWDITLNKGRDSSYKFTLTQVDGTLVNFTETPGYLDVQGNSKLALPVRPDENDPTIGWVDFTRAWIKSFGSNTKNYRIHYTFADGNQDCTDDATISVEGFE